MKTELTDTLHLRDRWPWLVALAALLLVMHALGPILTPFVVGALLAYLGDPLVDALERRRLSRTLSVALVFAVISLLLLLLVLLLGPMLQRQAAALIQTIPEGLRWVQDVALPKLGIQVPDRLRLDAGYVRKFITEHWDEAQGAAGAVAKSGLAVMAIIANLLLIPVVSFYLLRDWDRMLAWFDDATPPRNRALVRRLAGECDEVLGSFLRGQLLVMAALGLYYALALSLAGLKLALVVALIAGLFSFVPYLGFAIGFGTAVIAMLVQAPELWPVVWVVAIFLIGQLLEGNLLTPLLVGGKIGLHPVAVIFAILAGGQLFGFTGVLIALPAAAMLAVGLRELHRRWLDSAYFLWRRPNDSLPPASNDEPPPPAA